MARQIGDSSSSSVVTLIHSTPDSRQPSSSSVNTGRILDTMQDQLDAARQQIAWLDHSNARLRRQLTALANAESRAQYDTYHDPLTRLPNWRFLLDRLNQALVHALRQKKQVVLLLLDLDGLKTFNDKFGDAAGD